MNQIVVPSVVGLPATTAQAILRASGFRMSPTAPWGSALVVHSQAPPSGVLHVAGSTVTVIFGA